VRIVICWWNISGYMAACWRALAHSQGVVLKVIAFATDPSSSAPFDPRLLQGVDHLLLDARQRHDTAFIGDQVAAHRPDAVILCGWAHAPYLRLLHDPRLRDARLSLGMDTPWSGSLRQRFGWLKLRPYAARIHRVHVTGERAFRLARQLKFPESKIRRGFYGYDDACFSTAFETRRQSGPHPKRFLFTGSYDPRKGLDLILEGYARYRGQVADPWPLTCCGKGELTSAVDAAAGVENLGFVQPDDLPAVLAHHGAFVIASRYDPWPLVVLESSGTGLPVLCSEACGSAVELVRSYYNGITFPTGDAPAITRALRWAHDHYDQLPEMGRRGRELALAYAAPVWAQRIEEMFKD
jgi:glycosyltransferase involved in cell wall biosynthesis